LLLRSSSSRLTFLHLGVLRFEAMQFSCLNQIAAPVASSVGIRTVLSVTFSRLGEGIGSLLAIGRIIVHPIVALASAIKIALTPFMWLFTLFSLAHQFTRVQRLVVFGVEVGENFIFNRNDGVAVCNLCDQIVYNILTIDDIDPEDINCDRICPYGLNKCVEMCRIIISALEQATEYPCEALKMCPKQNHTPIQELLKLEEKDDAEYNVQCKLVYPLFRPSRCHPPDHCYKVEPGSDLIGKPHCALKRPLLMAYRRYTDPIRLEDIRLQKALSSKKYCGDLSRQELKENPLCIDRPTGWAYFAHVLQIFAVVIAVVASICAIETPTLQDDRSWLIFWMVLLVVHTSEDVADIYLSRYPLYFFLRLLFVIWLIPGFMFSGAENLYLTCRRVVIAMANAIKALE